VVRGEAGPGKLRNRSPLATGGVVRCTTGVSYTAAHTRGGWNYEGDGDMIRRIAATPGP
jgi:hypothetical protein